MTVTTKQNKNEKRTLFILMGVLFLIWFNSMYLSVSMCGPTDKYALSVCFNSLRVISLKFKQVIEV